MRRARTIPALLALAAVLAAASFSARGADPPDAPVTGPLEPAAPLRIAIDRFASQYPNGDPSVSDRVESVARMNKTLAIAGRLAVDAHGEHTLANALLPLLESKGDERYAAVRLLAVIGTSDPVIIDAIAHRLEVDPAPREIALTLERIGPPARRAAPTMAKVLREGIVLDAEDRSIVLQALMRLAPVDEPLLSLFVPAIAAPSGPLASVALRHLTEYARRLGDEDAARIVAIASEVLLVAPQPAPYLGLLERLGPRARPAVGAILRLYDGHGSEGGVGRVRRASADALLAIDPANEAVQTRMVEALRGSDPWLARWAAEGIGYAGRDAAAYVPDLEPWLDAPYVVVRREAALAIAILDGRLVEAVLIARPGDLAFRPRDPFGPDGVEPLRTYDLRRAVLGRLWSIWHAPDGVPFDLEINCHAGSRCRIRPVRAADDPLDAEGIALLERFCVYAQSRGVEAEPHARARFATVPTGK